jgi:hypothetical protein
MVYEVERPVARAGHAMLHLIYFGKDEVRICLERVTGVTW